MDIYNKVLDSDNKIYCYLKNKEMDVNYDLCSKCPYFGDTMQGLGVHCFIKEKEDEAYNNEEMTPEEIKSKARGSILEEIEGIFKSSNKIFKGHKYIRREGGPKNYKYIYKESGQSGSGEEISSLKFKNPERSGSKTKNEKQLEQKVDVGIIPAKRSDVKYESPKNSNCNLVGFVAFGKTTELNQLELNKKLQQSELILTKMGIRLKTPLDFTCQEIPNTSNILAIFHLLERSDRNYIIDIQTPDTKSAPVSIMHEIGHAIDLAMSTSNKRTRTDLITEKENKEAFKIIRDLEKVVLNTEFYSRKMNSEESEYLLKKTEMFARAFEVYSLKIAKDIVGEEGFSKDYIENFIPDIFKTNIEKIRKLNSDVDVFANIIMSGKNTLRRIERETAEEVKRDFKDIPEDARKEEEKDLLREDIEYVVTKKVVIENQKALKETLDQITSLKEDPEKLMIKEEKQVEYTNQISSLMKRLFEVDSIKKSIQEVDLVVK